MFQHLAPIALTMGDPAGIGVELSLKCWLSRDKYGIPPFCYFGDFEHIEHIARSLSLDIAALKVNALDQTNSIFHHAFPVYHIPLSATVQPGHPTVANAQATLASIVLAVESTFSGAASAVVTNPIAKHVLQAAGFEHPGHTEFLGQLARDYGCSATPVMMIASPQLRIVPLTIHIPLHAVPNAITPELIILTVQITAAALKRFFNIPNPRIAVTGLNPHAGENGSMGHEEHTVIAPAIASLVSQGLTVTGPHPADALFHTRAREAYDVVIAMYHDQALIPVKTLAFDEGVNVTLGLPFIRTSPDHGTAFDIAGTGRANPSSLMHALRLANTMARVKRGEVPPQ